VITVRLRDQIRAYQERTGERLTYAELARRTGLARATDTLASLTSYNTTLATIDKLCGALGCGVGDLLDYSSDESA
jgi:DNA-binding Xre family transcriptional regulator